MALTWREEVRNFVEGFPTDNFTLADVYDGATGMALRHPENNTVQDTIRRVLQELRDNGEVEFVGRGEYRRIGTSRRPYLQRISDSEAVTAPPLSDPAAPDRVPLENRSPENFALSARDASEAIQREQLLVEKFGLYLGSLQHDIARWRIPTASNSNLYTDIYDVTTDTLYEAKGSSSREHVRLAIGQLLDYQRYVHPKSLAVLLPERPSQDMIDLLVELGISCVFLEGSGFQNAS